MFLKGSVNSVLVSSWVGVFKRQLSFDLENEEHMFEDLISLRNRTFNFSSMSAIQY